SDEEINSNSLRHRPDHLRRSKRCPIRADVFKIDVCGGICSSGRVHWLPPKIRERVPLWAGSCQVIEILKQKIALSAYVRLNAAASIFRNSASSYRLRTTGRSAPTTEVRITPSSSSGYQIPYGCLSISA